MVAAHEGKTVKNFLIELVEARTQGLEWRGILPKGEVDAKVLLVTLSWSDYQIW